jgi:hypothetical protein
MSNSNLIDRMSDALDQFERGELPPRALEKLFDACMAGLERVRSKELRTAETLIGRLLVAHFVEDEIEFGHPDDVEKMIAECRKFLNSLPTD